MSDNKVENARSTDRAGHGVAQRLSDIGTEASNRIVSPRTEFQRRFAALYTAAGSPPLRRVAAADEHMRATRHADGSGGVGSQRISDWKAGRNLPARFDSFLPVLLTLIDKAEASGSPVPAALLQVLEWRRLWEAAVAREPESELVDATAPYLGLSSYCSTDADRFFGREKATTELIDLVRSTAARGGLVVLVGASGAGKSSLLRAGLVPAFRTAPHEWSVVSVTPGATPTKTVRRALTGAVEPKSPDRRLVVIDQFEELFTVCGDERERQAFIELIGELGTPGGGSPTVVVAAVRADFSARCFAYPILAEALRQSSYRLGSMSADELTRAIVQPAERSGLELAAGLEELVLAELCVLSGHHGEHSFDPAALPLLSHVMAATWRRREHRRLTLAGYRKAGGVVGSVAMIAEQAWTALSPAQQVVAQQLLLGLVTIGQDSPDTRRHATRAELVQRTGDPETAETVLEALIRARVVTVDATAAYLSHEIVLEAWPRLRAWIDEDRVGHLTRQRVEIDAAEWDSHHRDPSLRYRGAGLTVAENTGHDNLTHLAREFLAASSAMHHRVRRRAIIATAALAALGLVTVLLSIAALG
ncbi:hypothetical protein [Nocardia brasiliensis]|uniref:nSTAND1 domain-containing NTPase n=1 Tax=Nocardia brasiliensis TaxID=37326 RepID=UPI00366C6BB6